MIAVLIVLLILYQLLYIIYFRYICKPNFKNKSVFITGASSGIGEELAKKFVVYQAKTVYLASRNIAELKRVQFECQNLAKLHQIKTQIFVQQLDLIDPDEVLKFASNFQQKIDILVNNGGISQRDEFVNSDFNIAKHLMNVNCLSPIALIKGFMPQFLKNKNGVQIVNVLSVAGQIGVPLRSYYSASKFALDGFGKALQAELYHKKIRILQCYPAYVKTNVSINALVGKGKPFGQTDSNIENGMSVNLACQDLIIAIYLKRFQITLGSSFFYFAPKLMNLSEIICLYMGIKNYRQQMQSINQDRIN